MRPSNLGVTYQSYPPSIEVTEGELLGKTRGLNQGNSYPRHIPGAIAAVNLNYRRAAYCVNRKLDSFTFTDTNSSQPPPARWESEYSYQIRIPAQVANILKTNIWEKLERRMQAAKAKGDENLIRLLEEESKQLAGWL